MPRGDGLSHSKLSLSGRIRLIGEGFRSSMGRYPGDIKRSLAARRKRRTHRADEDFAHQWAALSESEGVQALAWLGHNTVLVRYGGMTILTDPVLSDRIGMRLPGLTIGPERLLPLLLTPRDLPRPDVIFVSHAHFDHLDRPTLKALVNRQTTVVTAKNTRGLIPRGFGHVHELDWERTLNLNGLELAAIRPNHWGARTAWDRHRGYNSYVFGPDSRRVLYAGDTAYTTNFDALGPLDLGIFGIGAYDPWIHAHASPEQVWKMASAAAVRRLLPVHHSTFKLSDEPADEPMRRLMAAAGSDHTRVIDAPPGSIVHLKK